MVNISLGISGPSKDHLKEITVIEKFSIKKFINFIGSSLKSRVKLSQVKVMPSKAPIGKLREDKLDFSTIRTQISFLEGKVLTIIEASIIDKEQQKAVKDLIKNSFRNQIDWICSLCYIELPVKSRSELEAQGLDLEEIEKNSEFIEKM